MRPIYFFIGTEAELIKIFPVIIECQKTDALYHIIATGQNDIRNSRIMEFINLNGKYLQLSKEKDICKSATGLLKWFLSTKKKALKIIRQNFAGDEIIGANMVVHGDTVSTMMGALVGKKLGMQVCHVEAGLRSHNLFNPFPEEIDRLVTSRFARVHFAPGDIPVNNLKKAKGRVINTKQNTLIDSLRFSKDIPIKSNIVNMLNENYFVFVMHRQENLASRNFVEDVVGQIVGAARSRKCVIILHKITERTFVKYGMMDELKSNENIVLLSRVDYFDFMKLLQNADFVITDGGSNQEELYYMNKTCLILRKATERGEGLGKNARLFNGDAEDINNFISGLDANGTNVQRTIEERPSKLIAQILTEN